MASSETTFIDYPNTDEIDPEQAKLLYLNHCAILILEDLPIGSEFGFDLVSYQVGEKFKGVKLIPPGIHFIYASALDRRNNRHGPRSGFYHVFNSKSILIKRWSSADEDFDDSYNPSYEETERYRTNLLDLDRFLAPYRFSSWASYSRLVHKLTPEFLIQVMPECNRIRSIPYLVDEGDSSKGNDSWAQGDISARILRSEKNLLPNLRPHPNTVIKFTEIKPNNEKLSKVTAPEMITQYNFNTTQILEMKFPGKLGRQRLLSELQFAFVTFLLCHLFECFEKWKELIRIVCLADIEGNDRGFVKEFLSIVEHQFGHVPQDLFDDIVDSNNLVRCMLDTLFQNIEDDSDKELVGQANHLRQYLEEKFNWQFFLEQEDEQPVVIDS